VASGLAGALTSAPARSWVSDLGSGVAFGLASGFAFRFRLDLCCWRRLNFASGLNWCRVQGEILLPALTRLWPAGFGFRFRSEEASGGRCNFFFGFSLGLGIQVRFDFGILLWLGFVSV